MRQFKTPAGEVHALRFAPDGSSIYFVSNEPYEPYGSSAGIDPGTASNIPGLPDLAALAQTWEMRLYQHAYRINIRLGEVTGKWPFSGSEVAIFTPDLRSVYHSVSVAVAGGELDLRRLDLTTGAESRVYKANVPYPSELAFTPNGHILAVAGSHYAGDGRDAVHRVDVWHGTELDPLPTNGICLAYSPDGSTLATGFDAVRLWRGKKIVEQWAEPATVLVWSADGQLAWGERQQLVAVRPGSGEPLRVWATNTPRYLTALTFSPDNRRLLAGCSRGVCTLHDALTGQQSVAFAWGIGVIHSVCFAPDGLTCAAGGENGQVVVWDVDS